MCEVVTGYAAMSIEDNEKARHDTVDTTAADRTIRGFLAISAE